MTEIQKGVLFLSEIDSFSPGPTGWFQKVKESSDHKRYYYHGSYKNCHKSSSREGLTKINLGTHVPNKGGIILLAKGCLSRKKKWI